jgi:hypothetical protein
MKILLCQYDKNIQNDKKYVYKLYTQKRKMEIGSA